MRLPAAAPNSWPNRMPAAAPAAISQIGESPNHQTASAVATATTISAGCIPRASAIVGTTISATTAARSMAPAAFVEECVNWMSLR